MNLKLFSVEFSTVVVVAAENEDDAFLRAEDDRREIRSEEDMDITVLREVTTDDLPAGWNEECIPYGDDGNTRIKDICN